jgi:hypothetical protein
MRMRRLFPLLILALLTPSVLPLSQSARAIASARALQTQGYNKDQPFGVVATLGNRVRDDEQDAAVALMREAGIQWAREEISWDKLQRVKDGPFLWGGDGNGFYNYDRSIERMHNAGINVLGLLAYNPAWFKSKNPTVDEWLNDWGSYIYQTVARYGRDRKQITYWEIWNEPNIRPSGYESGLYTIKDYVRVLDTARAAAKAADPNAVIVLGGVTSVWSDLPTPEDYDIPTYLRLLHDAGGWGSFDVLAIHPYNPGAPEAASWRRDQTQDFEGELRQVDALLQEFGSKPVWITEMGWSSYRGFYGVSETDQAAYMLRMYLVAMAHPAVERVFWYDLRNDTQPGANYAKPVYNDQEVQFHYGLLRRTYPLDTNRADLRKPIFAAYRTMTSILEGMRFEGVLANGDNPTMPGTFAYRYSGGGRSAVVLWRVNGASPPTMTINCQCQEARVRQWDGRLLSTVQTDGPVTVRLDYIGTPLYIEWGPGRGQDGQLFKETGHRLTQPFRRYWESNGGLSQFGYPITDQIKETDPGSNKQRVVQYFERNRFEYYPELNGTPFEIQIGRLGDDVLRREGIDWTSFPRQADAPPECTLFEQTGHRLCPPFKQYWESNGGLSLYGMPLSEAFEENGHLVQYFERNRFEHFPDKVGTPFEIQLGLLGRELYTTQRVWPLDAKQ